jgi:hypothetical protein
VWPYCSLLLLDDIAVRVGSDDPDVAARWAPWAIHDPAASPEDLVDYGVETRRSDPGMRDPRPLAVVRHGSRILGRSPDPHVVEEAFWRCLAVHRMILDHTELRVDAALVVRADGAVLVDRLLADALSARHLGEMGHRVFPVHHVLIRMTVDGIIARIPAPLVGDGSEIEAAVTAWLVPPSTSPCDHVSDVVAARAASVVSIDETDGSQQLRMLADILGMVALVEVEADRRALTDRVASVGVSQSDR